MQILASAPLWTDKLMVAITAVGVFGGVVALWLSLRQLKLQTIELASQTRQENQAINIRLAQRAIDLMRMVADLGRVLVEHPELAPYFATKEEVPRGEPLRSQVLAHAAGYMSLAETTGWQIHVGQMSEDAARAWRTYFADLYNTTPALQSVVTDNASLLIEEALWLFGRLETTEAVELLAAEHATRRAESTPSHRLVNRAHAPGK